MSGQPVPAGLDIEPHVLREYALIADGERGALVGPRGDVVWMCAPSWDSDAVFTSMIGGRGGYAITPVDRYVWGGSYEPGTLIWRSRWVTADSVVECREALAFPGEEHRAVLLRRVIAVDRDARVRIVLQPRAEFGKRALSGLKREGKVWTGRTGNLRMRWSGGGPAQPTGAAGNHALSVEMTVPAGEHLDLVLEISDQALPDEPVRPDDAWRATENAWHDAVPTPRSCLSPVETRQSYAVLRGLTSAGGGMVAAATTSLPERAAAGRNYDYRFVWIRDQCFAGQAVAADGPHELLDRAVRFVGARLLEHGDRLAPAYTASGDTVPDQRELKLSGYPGGHDRVGNWVNKQFQLDTFGESLLLFAAAARHDHLDEQSWRAAEIAINAIAHRWTEVDAGIWEIDNRAWTHSRLICAAGLRAIAAARPSGGRAGDWLALADRIVANTAAHALHPSGRWQRSPDDVALDGALLLPPIRGALPASDPRTVATLRGYEQELTLNGYAFRFRHDERPLPEAEGSFLFCGFLMALATHQQGEDVKAARWYERTSAACGPPVLYSEEFDPDQHQLRGNLPQAFVHALQFETSVRLAE
ncbi:MAG: glycoside hydrolase family 15 protein [Jatrophihabitantaceae bacterium]